MHPLFDWALEGLKDCLTNNTNSTQTCFHHSNEMQKLYCHLESNQTTKSNPNLQFDQLFSTNLDLFHSNEEFVWNSCPFCFLRQNLSKLDHCILFYLQFCAFYGQSKPGLCFNIFNELLNLMNKYFEFKSFKSDPENHKLMKLVQSDLSIICVLNQFETPWFYNVIFKLISIRIMQCIYFNSVIHRLHQIELIRPSIWFNLTKQNEFDKFEDWYDYMENLMKSKVIFNWPNDHHCIQSPDLVGNSSIGFQYFNETVGFFWKILFLCK